MKLINRYLSLDKKSRINVSINQETVGVIGETGELDIDTPKYEYELSFSTSKTKKKSHIYVINNYRIDRAVVEMKFILRIINILTVLLLSINFIFGDLFLPDLEPLGFGFYIGIGLLIIDAIFNLIIFKNNYFDVRFYDKESQLIVVDKYPYKKK